MPDTNAIKSVSSEYQEVRDRTPPVSGKHYKPEDGGGTLPIISTSEGG